MMEEDLKSFGMGVDALINGQNLPRARARELFTQILMNEQPDLQQGAFLAAITAKGPTPEEIAGIWEAIYEVDTVKVRPEVSGPLVENCGTGMDSIKTFNVSTAAALVAASDGVFIARHGARAITSRCGTVDLLESLGIDVECDAAVVTRSIENAGIGIFNGMSQKVHPQALVRILSQVRFGTVLNIAGSLANPALPTCGVRGVYSRDLVLPVAQAMKEIGYSRAITLYGQSSDGLRGMDEISTLGKTHLAELKDDGIKEYVIMPEDLGIKPGVESDLLSSLDRKIEAQRLLKVLSGEDTSPRRDMVCANAAPVLYISCHASSLREGVERAGEIIDSQRPISKLKAWVQEQSSCPEKSLERLQEMLEGSKLLT
jgi:anthranilate phosphoribosyltransferase